MKPERPLSTLVATLLLAVGSACGESSTDLPNGDENPVEPGHALLDPEHGVTLEMRKDSIEPAGSATLVLHNDSGEEVGHNLCFHVLETREGGEWKDAELIPPKACTLVLHMLAPGDSARYDATFPDPLPAGEYRFRAAVHLTEEASSRDLATQPFTVE